MISVRLVLTCLTFLLFSATATAQFRDGNKLKDHLEENAKDNGSPYKSGAGSGYVIGTVDTLADSDFKLICLPNGVTVGQVSDVVLKFLRANPEKLHEPAYHLVYLALRPSWGCKKAIRNSSQPDSLPPQPSAKPRPKPKEEVSPF